MRLVVDGRIFEFQARGGVNRIFQEVLPRLCALDPAVHVELRVHPAEVVDALPVHPRIRTAPLPLPHLGRLLRPSRVWARARPGLEAAARRLYAGPSRGRIWSPTYYTPPPFGWRGPRTVWVYDTVHERYPATPGAFPERKRRVIEGADAVLCISAATRDDVATRYRVRAERLHVVPLAQGAAFRVLPPGDAPAAPEARPFLLFVGARTATYKGFDTLLDAYAAWPRRADVDLVVVGPDWTGPESARLRALRLDAGPDGARVRRHEAPDDEALVRLYNAAAALVYPSRFEGFGIPPLEALACGCPLVASRIPTTAEACGDLPHYFAPGDAEGLRDALDRALDEGRGARTERGRAHAATFSWDQTARRALEVFRTLRPAEAGATP